MLCISFLAYFIALFPYSFYTVNEVQKFQYSRPFRKGEKDPENEFAVIIIFLFVCFMSAP